MNSCLQNSTTDIKLKLNLIAPYVNLPSALAFSVIDTDFPLKETLLNEMFGFAQTLAKRTMDFEVHEKIWELSIDPMQELINFCFETGMVLELMRFFEQLQMSLVNKYGMYRIEPITTKLLYFGEKVVNGLKHVDHINMSNSDWSEFLEQVKSCVFKWTQLISTPQHEHEKEPWMDRSAESISKKCDLFLEI